MSLCVCEGWAMGMGKGVGVVGGWVGSRWGGVGVGWVGWEGVGWEWGRVWVCGMPAYCCYTYY